jgi:hypothetical protein
VSLVAALKNKQKALLEKEDSSNTHTNPRILPATCCETSVRLLPLEECDQSHLPASLFVIHDTAGSGQDDVAERTGRQKQIDPVFNIANGAVESRRHDSSLVDAAIELNDNFARSVVVNLFELVDVTFRQSQRQECSLCVSRGSIPCFWRTVKKRTMTFEEGRIMTCRLPAFSAL